MKKNLQKLFAVLMLLVGTISAHAEAYVLWCEGNTTLYFLSSNETLAPGDTHDGQTITKVWSGTAVTEVPLWSGGPGWAGNDAITAVVFEESFKTVRPIRFWLKDT